MSNPKKATRIIRYRDRVDIRRDNRQDTCARTHRSYRRHKAETFRGIDSIVNHVRVRDGICNRQGRSWSNVYRKKREV